jgi:hypothetical protein
MEMKNLNGKNCQLFHGVGNVLTEISRAKPPRRKERNNDESQISRSGLSFAAWRLCASYFHIKNG